MDGVLADVIKNILLTSRLGATPFGTLQMGLSYANISPTRTNVLGDFTGSEVPVSGYARQTVGTWGSPSLSSGVSTALAAPVTFVNTGGSDSSTIYTWFLVDTSTNTLVMAGRFSVPFVLVATTGTVTFTPFWRLNGDT